MWKIYSQIESGSLLLLGGTPAKWKIDGLKFRKHRFSWFSELWSPWKPLFVDLNILVCPSAHHDTSGMSAPGVYSSFPQAADCTRSHAQPLYSKQKRPQTLRAYGRSAKCRRKRSLWRFHEEISPIAGPPQWRTPAQEACSPHHLVMGLVRAR